MIPSDVIKLAQETAKNAEKLARSIPKIQKSFEKHLSKEDIETIRTAYSVSDYDKVMKDLTKAKKDYDVFMKQYGSKVK